VDRKEEDAAPAAAAAGAKILVLRDYSIWSGPIHA
jgi:hypothetical protein